MKQSHKKGERNKIGGYGEEIAKIYLEKRGFQVISQNYLKKWGEIDIVSRETGINGHIIHFVEVKTVSHETKKALKAAVSRETWRPEENVHYKKLQRMHRAIESWLGEHECSDQWQIDIIAVRLVISPKYATVTYIPNIIY